MKIDEAKEREAFEAWFKRYGCDDHQWDITQSAWLARAAQPVTVTREAVGDAAYETVIHAEQLGRALHALGIKVV